MGHQQLSSFLPFVCRQPSPIFAKESFFMNFTADGKMDDMFVALEDTYFDDYAACLE